MTGKQRAEMVERALGGWPMPDMPGLWLSARGSHLMVWGKPGKLMGWWVPANPADRELPEQGWMLGPANLENHAPFAYLGAA